MEISKASALRFKALNVLHVLESCEGLALIRHVMVARFFGS